jgi:hypothetical protein
MSRLDVTLVCDGVPKGPDLRWLSLVMSTLAESYEPASGVRVVPAGSKADLGAAVRGMRESLRKPESAGAPRVFAVRDRDFLRAEHLRKDEAAGVYSLERHCLESYLLEPATVEAALGVSGVAERIQALAEARFWADVATAVLDAVGYELRKDRLHLDGGVPADRAEATRIVDAKLLAFRKDLAEKPVDVDEMVGSFERDMRSAPLFTRVRGKELLRTLAAALGPGVVRGGDIEAALFKWCTENGPPAPFVADVGQILKRMLAAG